MKKSIVLLLLALSTTTLGKSKPDAESQLTAMLNNFLAAASHTPPSAADKEVFNRFFADDVIYTRAAGVVITKQEIMRSLDDPPSPGDPVATYSAEGVTIKPHGDFAIVAFRLVQKLPDGSSKSFRNTGTFMMRNHHWQAIAWQATAVPSAGEKK